jgi:hypothetical protein
VWLFHIQARLCLNSVIVGDYQLPTQIARFVSELYAGYRLLNLKNDFLRKRMDSIKYDVKKIEEVVYDITVRGLNKTPLPSSPSMTTATTATTATTTTASLSTDTNTSTNTNIKNNTQM